MTVLDLSNYQYPANGACLKAAGVTGIIVGAQIPNQSQQIIDACKEVGIPCIGVYAFLWDVESPAVRVTKAIALAVHNAVNRVWLDAEDGNNLPGDVPQRLRDLRAAVAMVQQARLTAGIYTYEYFWRDKLANSDEFKGLPLWYANYGANDGNKPPVRTVDFGGWSAVAIHQYTSVFPACGTQMDANYVFEEVEADEVTKEEQDALIARVASLETSRYQLAQQVFGTEPAADGKLTDGYANTTIANLLELTNGHLANHGRQGPAADDGYVPEHTHGGVVR